MSEGYKRKIDSIVDKIIDGNLEFNKKTKKDQESSKNEINDSIKKAISGLNNKGKRLVLDELSAIVNQKSSIILDKNGNINILEITSVTRSIVNTKLQEAKINGIDLTGNMEISSKSNFVPKEDLSVSRLSDLAENYRNLSRDERDKLCENFSKLSSKDKAKIMKQVEEESKDRRRLVEESNLSKKEKEEWNEKEQQVEDSSKTANDSKSVAGIMEKISQGCAVTEEEYEFARSSINLLYTKDKNNPIFKEDNDIVKKFLNGEDISQEEAKNLCRVFSSYSDQLSKEAINLNNGLAQKAYEVFVSRDANSKNGQNQLSDADVKQAEESQKIISQGRKVKGEIKQYNPNDKQVYLSNEIAINNQQPTKQHMAIEEILGMENTIESPINVSEEIEQITTALIEVEYSEGQLQEAFSEYKKFIEGLEEEDIDYLAELTNEDRTAMLKSEFSELEVNPQTAQILDMMAGMTFGGKIREILIDSEKRESFLAELGKVADRGIEEKQGVQQAPSMDDMMTQFFGENAVDLDVSAIEAQSQTKQVEKQQVAQPQVPPRRIETSNRTSIIENNSAKVTDTLDRTGVEEDSNAGDTSDTSNNDSNKTTVTIITMNVKAFVGAVVTTGQVKGVMDELKEIDSMGKETDTKEKDDPDEISQ